MDNSKHIETNVVKPKLSIFQNEVEHRLISVADENLLDSKIKEIEDFMSSKTGRGESEEVKDELYVTAQKIWKEYYDALVGTQYTFFLNRKQYTYLVELLRDRMEYDVNTLFYAIELTNMLGSWLKSNAKYTNDEELKGFQADATEVTYIYHLISKHKVKGLTSASYTFAEIIKRIGDISKVVSYYDTSAKNLSTEIQNWVATFDEKVNIEGKGETAKGKTLSPKKKKEEVSE